MAFLEEFLERQNSLEEFKTVLLFLKLHSKDLVFGYETKERWLSTYPEAHKKMYKYVGFYGLKRIVLFYLYTSSNVGIVSKILELYSKFKDAK